MKKIFKVSKKIGYHKKLIRLIFSIFVFILILEGACDKNGAEKDTNIDSEVIDSEIFEEELYEEDIQLDESESLDDSTTLEEFPVDSPSDISENIENCPPPPYGIQVGDVIRPHQFISINDEIISLCDFYNDTSVKLLLIYATAGWCSVCHQESMKLPVYYRDYHSQGLEILAAVFEDEQQNPATREYARSYATRYGFTFPTVVDNTFQLGIYFDRAATPMNMFVDLTTMKILAIDLGFDYLYDSMRDDIEVYLSRISR